MSGHTPERSHVSAAFCGKLFGRFSDLMLHERTQTMEGSFILVVWPLWQKITQAYDLLMISGRKLWLSHVSVTSVARRLVTLRALENIKSFH